MQFTIAAIKKTYRIAFNRYGFDGELAHEMRGVPASQYQRVVDEGQRLLVTAKGGETAKPDDIASALEALDVWFLKTWLRLFRGAEGYVDLADVSDLEAQRRYFTGESLPADMDPEDRALVVGELLAHVKQAVTGWMGANEVPSFRDPSIRDGTEAGAQGGGSGGGALEGVGLRAEEVSA